MKDIAKQGIAMNAEHEWKLRSARNLLSVCGVRLLVDVVTNTVQG